MDRTTRQRAGAVPSGQLLPSLNPFLGLLPVDLWSRTKDFFCYTINFLPATLSVTTSQTLNIQGDADFLVLQGVRTAFATDNTTVLADPPFLVTIKDTGSGRDFLNVPTHIENLFGTAQLPATWPFPKLLRANSAVQIDLQNLSATSYNIRLGLLGFKVFPY